MSIPTAVFLDTSILDGQQYNFQSTALATFVPVCVKRSVKLLLPERRGLLAAAEGVRIEESNLRIAVRNIARLLGDDVSEEVPILDARLPDGSRVAAVLPPCSLGGTTLAIRKFQPRLRTCAELVRVGMLTGDT